MENPLLYNTFHDSLHEHICYIIKVQPKSTKYTLQSHTNTLSLLTHSNIFFIYMYIHLIIQTRRKWRMNFENYFPINCNNVLILFP